MGATQTANGRNKDMEQRIFIIIVLHLFIEKTASGDVGAHGRSICADFNSFALKTHECPSLNAILLIHSPLILAEFWTY